MKKSRFVRILLVTAVIVCMMFPVQTAAAGKIDLNRDVSLTLSYNDNSTPLTGAVFDIYLVADVDEYGRLAVTDDFKDFNVNILGKNDDAWRALASTLEGYVLRDNIAPADSGKINSSGTVSFPGAGKRLTQGLYLVLGHRHTQSGSYYDASPFVVLLPGLDREANDWIYNMTANVKYDTGKVPSKPSTVSRKVLKVWEDDDHEAERPDHVVVQLLKDGNVYDTVTLNEDNNWRYTWTGLDENSKWNIVEKEMDDYVVEVTQEGLTFVVKNIIAEDIPDDPEPLDPIAPPNPDQPVNPDQPSDPNQPENPGQPSDSGQTAGPTLPQTGQLWWPVPVLTAAGMLLLLIGLIRRRSVRNEK